MDNSWKKRFWMPDYADDIDVLLANIPKYLKEIHLFIEDPENRESVDEYLESHWKRYIIEHHRNAVVQRVRLPEHEEQIATNKNKMKEENMKKALEYVFGDARSSFTFTKDFNINLVSELHEILGKQLFSTDGYRRKEVQPSGYKFYYLESHEIETRMKELFQRVTHVIEAGRNDWYEIANGFYRDFLYIHPFPNGNGRIAGILLSALLVNYTIAPVSLFPWRKNSNEVYLRCLQEAHEFGNDASLKCLIIESVHSSLESFKKELDL